MGSRTPPWLHHVGPTMVARAWPRPSPRQLEDLRRPSASSRCFSFVSAALLWMDRWIPLLGRPRGCIYALGEPWGVLQLALHEIFLGGDANLVSINSTSSRFSWFAALPCRHHMTHVQTLNNANFLSRLCATKLSPTLVFIGFLGNQDKIPKTASEYNLSDFRLVCATGILGAISPSSFTRIGSSTFPNRRYRRGAQLWYSNFWY
jgi:hypothetical protein